MDSDFVSVEEGSTGGYDVVCWTTSGVPKVVAANVSRSKATAMRDSIARAFESWDVRAAVK